MKFLKNLQRKQAICLDVYQAQETLEHQTVKIQNMLL